MASIEQVTSSGPAPIGNLSGFSKYWRNDFVSGLFVFLIALPLCLAISAAAGFPPIAGVLTAICGGLIAPWISNSELTIKGPAAGLIMIMAGAFQEMSSVMGPEKAYSAALAIGFVAGLCQILLGFLKSGFIGEFFPLAVVHGMLAAIGVIIISKQAHQLLGVVPHGKEPLHLLAEIPHSIANLNPLITIVGALSLVLLFGLAFFGSALTKRLPAPMIVLLVAIPLAYYLGFGEPREYSFLGSTYEIKESALVTVPYDITKTFAFPDFEALTYLSAWKWVLLYVLIGTLESILSAKAIDMLDPYRRKTNMNLDLLAIGVSNTVASCIGGLPMISEIVRSKANIDNGAKTRFGNFWHGLFLLFSIAFLARVIHLIPNSALAAMLVFTGFRLASPNEFIKVFKTGKEQLAVFVFTLVAVLATDLLIGILLGIALKFVIHVANGVPINSLFKRYLDIETLSDGSSIIHANRSAVFSNWIPFRQQIEYLGLVQRSNIVIDFSETKFVDHTVMEKLHELQSDFEAEGLTLELRGLDSHHQMGRDSLAARRLDLLATYTRIRIEIPIEAESAFQRVLDSIQSGQVVRFTPIESYLTDPKPPRAFCEFLVEPRDSDLIVRQLRPLMLSTQGALLTVEKIKGLMGPVMVPRATDSVPVKESH